MHCSYNKISVQPNPYEAMSPHKLLLGIHIVLRVTGRSPCRCVCQLTAARPGMPNSWWCVLAALVAVAGEPTDPRAVYHSDGDSGGRNVSLCVVTLDGAGDTAAALGALAAAALGARGVRSRSVHAPPHCARGAGASAACRRAVLRGLVAGQAQVAILPLPAARPPHVLELRDNGLEELGDATPPVRLACAASGDAGARSLLDFVDEALAARYGSSSPNSGIVSPESICSIANRTVYEYTPEWCETGTPCAVLLTGYEEEARELEGAVRRHRLRVRVRAIGSCLTRIDSSSATGPSLVCAREVDPAALRLTPIGTPPCLATEDVCPFDPYRLVKVVNARELVYSPTASRILGRLAVTDVELRELVRRPATGARELVERHREWTAGGEVRVAVMIPASTQREAFDGAALRAAAVLAEQDAPRDDAVDFKVELLDDGCAATQAFKYLTDAPGAEYGALSGVAGPACGAAFADVARQSPGLRLPVLAYTPQAPPPGAALSLLAAGDSRQYARAWAALAAQLGWRRVSLLSELATRATVDPADLGLDVVVHVELTADRGNVDFDLITRWAERTAAVHGRVLYVSAEDARVVRAALCAGAGAGLLPRAGAVWLLPAALPPRWLRRAPADAHNCSDERLREAADGHLSVAPAWMRAWRAPPAWERRWRAHCGRACGSPPPHAAALYDALRLWHAALRRLLRDDPAAVDDIHCNATVRSLVRDATATNYSGLTGTFEWAPAGEGLARVSPLVLLQWINGSSQRAGEWREGAGLSALALRWLTADGRTPDDGTERCALQPLAELLHADCRTAFVALGAVLLLLLAIALGAAAYWCKRRAEREYRRRLAALGLRELGPKPGGLDRWEIPRERVVINRKLGTGAFGTVYGGHALLAEDRGWSAVAVKTLKAGATTDEKLDFLSEAEAMKRFEHKNVVRLLGVVTKTEPVCTVMEFMLYGDLKNYLLARRHLGASGEAGEEVSAARLTSMALDAARALSYLAQLRYVHRDVAARNCLVSAHRVVKLADFGMTRLVFDNDYYRFSRKGMLPVRWMAPESLALGVFSPASDVWSFGVLLYEIVTFGSLPFQGLSNAEVLSRVKAGHTLDLPPGLKPQLAGLIKSCWSADYKARPGAAEVAAFLAEWPRLLAPCLDVPLDALALDPERDPTPWRLDLDRAEARWVSWGAPASATTDTTYLSSDAPPPSDTDSFLP
ncbi:unnamed protein product [Arctia plantaginis]|uniref:receptor protein-tyrosine kinase n=1 Tax=Arctia plantaginis TaxID=874455 RepID=A0A8S0ZBJ6_ARCPL|nr:unnamed protein product [Arctia plantaginis]